MTHTIKNQYFFDIGKIFSDYITNHNKKFDLYLFKCGLILVINNFSPHIRTHFHQNTTILNLKRYLLFKIEYFTERGPELSHINEMNYTTINDEMDMTYEEYFEQPMQAVELRLNVIDILTIL